MNLICDECGHIFTARGRDYKVHGRCKKCGGSTTPEYDSTAEKVQRRVNRRHKRDSADVAPDRF